MLWTIRHHAKHFVWDAALLINRTVGQMEAENKNALNASRSSTTGNAFKPINRMVLVNDIRNVLLVVSYGIINVIAKDSDQNINVGNTSVENVQLSMIRREAVSLLH